MNQLQIVVDGIVVNLIAVGDEISISADLKSATWGEDSYTLDGDGELWNVDGAQIGWVVANGTLTSPTPPAPSLPQMKELMQQQVDAKVDAVLASGAPLTGGLHISLDDSSRADMGSMATTALAASSGAVSWPDSYKQGWISIENTRIPLATPADGLALAAGVGDYYAKVRQNGRSLKDQIIAATTVKAVAAIDIDTGWPV